MDNGGDVLSLRLAGNGQIIAEPYTDTLCGTVKLKADGYCVHTEEGTLYSTTRPKLEPVQIDLIPYYTWGNRGLNEMRVWLPEV